MARVLTVGEGTREGEVLAFIAEVVREDGTAAVPAECAPVLLHDARCRPDTDGCFRFRWPAGPVPCGCVERVAALLLLVLCLPVLTVTALLVLLCDGWPVVFRQERFGFRGRPFVVYKFRTMDRRAETLHARLQRRRRTGGRLFKLERDPRVTRLGALLRRTFVDELPQLVNVVRGEMRLVGPRPLPASDQDHYTQPAHALRLEGLPGMTGLWQVSGRNRLTFDAMCLLDIYYLCHRSRRFDLLLIARTVGVVFEQIGLRGKAQRAGEHTGGIADAGRRDHEHHGKPAAPG